MYQWTHVAASFDAFSRILTLFVDGQVAASTMIPSNYFYRPILNFEDYHRPLFIGRGLVLEQGQTGMEKNLTEMIQDGKAAAEESLSMESQSGFKLSWRSHDE